MHKALLAAFPSRSKFAMLLGQRFNILYDSLTPQDVVNVEYWNILVEAEAQGWLEALARAAHEAVPGNSLLADLMLDDGLTSGARIIATANGTPSLVAESAKARLERLVRDNSSFIDITLFLARLSALEGQTCRIELAGAPPRAIGTGFLVGPDLMMTNQHVIDGLAQGAAMICRFDYLVDAGGVRVREGVTVPVADDWLVKERPPDPSDKSLEDGIPAPDNLDFALIRLSQRVGDKPRAGSEGPDNPPRGWIGIDPTLHAAPNDDLFILQHPEGAPMKLGVGRLTALHGAGLRWRHDVATEPGSSGSPVFNRKLNLIGLHHAGDPNYFRNALFNQAIPMDRIVGWLQGKVDPFWTQAPP